MGSFLLNCNSLTNKYQYYVKQEAQRLYAELLFFMFYILYIYFFLVIFLQKFNLV